MSNTAVHRFAYFITPHGYGHAARSVAVMNAVYHSQPGTMFDIYTRVPLWFFQMSNEGEFHYHELLTDIGLVQTTSMEENLPETVRRLDEFLPFDPNLVQSLARQVRQDGCEKVLCDIAPFGIAVARAAGIPSVLVENFTWDWIYAGYLAEEPAFAPHIAYLERTFASADMHIRTEPACDSARPADLETSVVSRKPRRPAEATRNRLGIAPDERVVMITMGGILTQYPFLARLENSPDTIFLVPGGSDAHERRGSLVVIPHQSDLYHPDLVAAADVMVGKLGYSTLAEAYAAGIPYAYVPRPRFRESEPIGQFARTAMGAVELSGESFFNGEWLDRLPDLLDRPRKQANRPNGADQIARRLLAGV